MNQPLVCICDDDTSICKVISQALARAGFDARATTSPDVLWQWLVSGKGDAVLLDVVLPGQNGFEVLGHIKKLRANLPVIIMSAQNTVMTAIRASEQGAFDYLPKPFDINQLVNSVTQAVKEKTPGIKDDHANTEDEKLPIIGRSAAMQETYRLIARLIQNDLTVIIFGESGTGKELVARALHHFGKRKKGEFVALNMAAIPRELIESELFGYEKGAFTGADRRKIGRFEQASGGTLFLDEIGDMPLDAQTRLLRVLQEGEFIPVGGRTPIKANVRIVAATHRSLPMLIQQGLFREDLYYRLNVAPLYLPALRDRKEDIPDLVAHFLQISAEEGLRNKSFDQDALTALKSHSWPGNVRELENLVRRLLAFSLEDVISKEVVEEELARSSQESRFTSSNSEQMTTEQRMKAGVRDYTRELFASLDDTDTEPDIYRRLLEKFEEPLLCVCLEHCHGNKLRAAQLLGLNRNTLRKKLGQLDK